MVNRIIHDGCDCTMTRRLADFTMTQAQATFEAHGEVGVQVAVSGSVVDVVASPENTDEEPEVSASRLVSALYHPAGCQYVTVVVQMRAAAVCVATDADEEEIARLLATVHPAVAQGVGLLTVAYAVDPIPAEAMLSFHAGVLGRHVWSNMVPVSPSLHTPLNEAIVTAMECAAVTADTFTTAPGIPAVHAALAGLPGPTLASTAQAGWILSRERAR